MNPQDLVVLWVDHLAGVPVMCASFQPEQPKQRPSPSSAGSMRLSRRKQPANRHAAGSLCRFPSSTGSSHAAQR